MLPNLHSLLVSRPGLRIGPAQFSVRAGVEPTLRIRTRKYSRQRGLDAKNNARIIALLGPERVFAQRRTLPRAVPRDLKTGAFLSCHQSLEGKPTSHPVSAFALNSRYFNLISDRSPTEC